MRVVVGVTLAVAALVLVAALRLLQGPVDLDFLKDRLAAAADVPGNDIRPEADRVSLEWGGLSQPMRLVFTGMRFVNIQNWDEGTWHFSRERALVGPDAALQWTVGGLGSWLAKVNQEVVLTGQGARAQVNGVMFTTGRQHLAYFTRQDHAAPHTTSDLLYKGGLKDKSRVVWKGMIRVEKDAQRTDAYQKNDNLVLSESARAD